jgi:hypothetical protein
MLNNSPDLSKVGGFLMEIALYHYNKIGMRSQFTLIFWKLWFELRHHSNNRHWCSLIKGEKRYGVRLRGNGEIIKT